LLGNKMTLSQKTGAETQYKCHWSCGDRCHWRRNVGHPKEDLNSSSFSVWWK